VFRVTSAMGAGNGTKQHGPARCMAGGRVCGARAGLVYRGRLGPAVHRGVPGVLVDRGTLVYPGGPQDPRGVPNTKAGVLLA